MAEKITSDIFDITKFINNLKSDHIDVENEDSLYAGTFGYMGEVFSNILQNTIRMSSEWSNELIPTRAKYDRNVMVYAKALGIGKIEATPATMKILLCIPESCVLNNLANSQYVNENQCLLDSTFPITIEDVEFHFDNDIIITRVQNDALMIESKVAYTAEYRLEDGSTNSKYLPTIGIFKLNERDNMLVLTTTLRQIMYHEIEKSIVSDNNIMNKAFNFTFSDQLVKFDVCIYEGNSTVPIILTPVYDGLYNNESKYCWYEYLNENIIRVKFDQNSYRPKINSKVIVRLYTTLGASGNFKYNLDVNTIMTSSEKATYNIMKMIIKQREEGSIGGLDRATVEELQKIIPKERLSRGSVTTLTDLKNFFNSFNTETSTMHVFRKEDNILTRVYYAYALMKDENSNILPTNTIQVRISSSTINATNKKTFIEAGTPIIYRLENGVYMGSIVDNYPLSNNVNSNPSFIPLSYLKPNTLLRITLKMQPFDKYSWVVKVIGNTITNSSGTSSRVRIIPVYNKYLIDFLEENDVDFPEEISYSDILGYEILDGFLYTAPYSIAIYDPDSVGEGRPDCSYYINTLNETYFLNFDYINSNSDIQFIASNIKVVRPSFLSTERYNYTISINLTPNTGSRNHLDSRFIQCVALIYNKNDNSPIAYSIGELRDKIDPLYPDDFIFDFKFNTKSLLHQDINTITEDNRIWIHNLWAPGVKDNGEWQKEDKYLTEEIDIKIFTLYKYQDATTFGFSPISRTTHQNIPIDLLATIPKEFNFITGKGTEQIEYTIQEMTITNIYSPSNKVNLFYNYSERLSSYVAITKDMINNRMLYIINRVPVIRYFYFTTEERVLNFLADIRKKLVCIELAVESLETLFAVNFKLFNTYGPSNMYKLTENGLPDQYIDRVNLTLNFRTQLYSNTDRSIIDSIKNEIKEYIEDIQTLGNLHMPNLVSIIIQNYKDHLIYFEFLGFSNGIHQWDENYQHIITTESMDMLTVVPEFLNVNFNDETGEPDINIDIIENS